MQARNNTLVLITFGPLKGLVYFLALPFIGVGFIILALVYRAIQGAVGAWRLIASTKTKESMKMEKVGIMELLDEDQMQPLVDRLDCELLVVDHHFQIAQYCKPSLHQYEPIDTAVGQYCYKFAHGVSTRSECDCYDCPVQTVMETNKKVKATHYHRNPMNPEGGKRRVEILASPVRNELGDVTHVAEFVWAAIEHRI
jgi:hypothetical protein